MCIIIVPVCCGDVSEEEQVSLCFCCVHLLHARVTANAVVLEWSVYVFVCCRARACGLIDYGSQ